MRPLSLAILVLVNVAAAVAAYGVFEHRVRAELQSVYKNNATPMMVLNQVLWYEEALDGYFGRSIDIGPGNGKVDQTITTAFITRGENRFQSVARTNNLGLLSNKRYAFERPADRTEFRVYVAGDSMTGSTTMDFQWVDLVEDILNSDAGLAETVGVDAFRTYNGGVPGAGFNFFWDHYDKVGRRFDPDMVIVNYIESDFPRVGRSGHERHTDDEAHMIDNAAEHSQKLIATLGDRVHFTVMPLYQDLYPDLSGFERSKALSRAIGRPVTFMHERLPWQTGPGTVRTWYNLPLDGHMSEIGGLHYAKAMAELIAERLTGRKWVFERPQSVHLPEDLPEAEAFFTSESRAKSLFKPLQSGHLSNGPIPVNGTAVASPSPGWMVIADGPEGQGVLKVGLLAADRSKAEAASSAILRVIQASASTDGVPSVNVDASGWRELETDTVLLGFRVRLPEAKPDGRAVSVLQAFFGSGANTPPPQTIHVEHLSLTPEWTDYIVRVELPRSDAEIGENDIGAILRLQLIGKGQGEPFNIDFADPIILPDRPSLRQDRSRVIVGDRELPVSAFASLRERLDETYLETRRKSWRLYGINRLLGREIPYGFLPAGVPYVAGFVPLELETDPPETVLLNVFCTDGEISLANPDCYHSYQIYAR